MAYVMFVALEITPEAINRTRGKQWQKQKLWLDPHLVADKNFPVKTVRRLMGVAPEDSSLIKKILDANFEPLGPECQWRTEKIRNVTLFRLSSYSRFRFSPINSVLLIKLAFSEGEIAEVTKFKRLSSKSYSETLVPLGFDGFVDKSSAVHPVIGTIAPEGDEWGPEVRDGWIHIQGDYLHEKVLQATVARVAIERALLNWAVSPKRGLRKLVHPALVGYRLRQWRVEFLSDWESITKSHHALRASLNLHRVREEWLSISKNWWTVVGSLSTLSAFVIAVVTVAQP